MIARPYSPELFRQGPPAGPHYLLEVLRGNLTRQQAVKEWDAEDKRREESSGHMQESKWPFCMTLPCRMCSDLTQVSTFKQIQAFVPSKSPHRYSTADEFQDFWMECIAKGGDPITGLAAEIKDQNVFLSWVRLIKENLSDKVKKA